MRGGLEQVCPYHQLISILSNGGSTILCFYAFILSLNSYYVYLQQTGASSYVSPKLFNVGVKHAKGTKKAQLFFIASLRTQSRTTFTCNTAQCFPYEFPEGPKDLVWKYAFLKRPLTPISMSFAPFQGIFKEENIQGSAPLLSTFCQRWQRPLFLYTKSNNKSYCTLSRRASYCKLHGD